MKKRAFILLLTLCGITAASEQTMSEQSVIVDGVKRTFYTHLPKKYSKQKKYPLVIILHGGGGNPLQIARHSQFQSLADKYGFIVAFPRGLNKHWNDGRKVKAHLEQDRKVSDVKFIRQAVKQISAKYNIDSKRIFAAGISNGGFMCQRLAVEASDIFAAVTSITASLPERWKNTLPVNKISVMLINGTADPLVPYHGGEVTLKFPLLMRTLKRGKILSTDKTIAYWLKVNDLKAHPVITDLKNINPDDGCHAVRYDWRDKSRKSRVTLIKVINGGHT
jgi:polyhydroxybutyrate depolymerase